MFKKLKLVIIMPRRIVFGYILLELLILILPKYCHVPQFSVILVNFSEFLTTGSWGCAIIRDKSVILVRGVRLLESVRLLERIRWVISTRKSILAKRYYKGKPSRLGVPKTDRAIRVLHASRG